MALDLDPSMLSLDLDNEGGDPLLGEQSDCQQDPTGTCRLAELARVAHDLNNLLTVGLGRVQAALDLDSVEPNARKELKVAARAIRQAQKLSRRLMGSAVAVESDEPEAIDVGELLREVGEFLLDSQGVTWEIKAGKGVEILADRSEIFRMLSNLVLNAREATDSKRGRIVLTAMHLESLTPGRAPVVRVEIRDNGCGIPEPQLNNIFDARYSTKAGGSGLGLDVVRQVVKRCKGTIDVDSRLGEGTTFTLLLPGIERQEITRHRVLLMDDDRDVGQVISAMLRTLGFDVEYARSSMEAVDLCRAAVNRNARFDLAILDFLIPGELGGVETIPLLLDLDPNISALVSSGYTSDPIVNEYQSHGFAGFIAKPYDLSELRSALDEVLESSATRGKTSERRGRP
ncbi:MAG: hypothetical protein AUK47_00365 [Deltaproteobacteria bacterium CG2_30_63_29]|nr:MAG: hypothetical protein AUK47_00365 [Deltaproteobacteria bacterium CG2_30_63_29]